MKTKMKTNTNTNIRTRARARNTKHEHEHDTKHETRTRPRNTPTRARLRVQSVDQAAARRQHVVDKVAHLIRLGGAVVLVVQHQRPAGRLRAERPAHAQQRLPARARAREKEKCDVTDVSAWIFDGLAQQNGLTHTCSPCETTHCCAGCARNIVVVVVAVATAAAAAAAAVSARNERSCCS